MSSRNNYWSEFSLSFQGYIVTCLKVQEGFSQADVGELLSMDQGSISRLEKREQGSDIYNGIILILHVYFPDVSIMQFLDPEFVQEFHNSFLDKYKPTTYRVRQLNERAQRLISDATKIKKINFRLVNPQKRLRSDRSENNQ